MWFQRSKVICLLFALLHSSQALSLIEVLASTPELSTLYERVNSSTVINPLLAAADDFTFFAPSNTAIATFLKSQLNATSDAAFQALIQYSLVKGGFARVSFTEEPQFVKSNLVDAKYANVTGGQALELVERGGQAVVISGNQTSCTLSKTDILSAGGIIHIVDQPLTLPAATINAITDSRLSFFVSLLTRGGYLSRATNQYVHQILDSTDVTYFIPNTAEALANFTANSANWQEEDFRKGFQYHVIPKYVGYSDNLKNGTSLTTVEGSNLTIYKQGDDIYVNSVKVISTDLLVSNGVVHVIEEFLDRNNTAPPLFMQRTSDDTTNATATPTETPTSTPEPTSTPTVAPTSSSSSNGNLTLKVALGAGIGGAAVLVLIGILVWLSRRKKHNRALPPPRDRESSVWDGHSMSTAPSDPKRYFVNRDGVVQQRPDRSEGIVAGRLADRNSGGPPGYVPPTMVTVTNLERGEAAQRYYSGGKRAEGNAEPPMRSPSRLNNGDKSYF